MFQTENGTLLKAWPNSQQRLPSNTGCPLRPGAVTSPSQHLAPGGRYPGPQTLAPEHLLRARPLAQCGVGG